jgi:hypothetical protein
MQHLSQHYRYDDSELDIDPEMLEYLERYFLKQLHNLDKSNPKVLIVFSGGNAVGKSTLSIRIEKEFDGLVIENDAVRRCVLRFNPKLAHDRDKLSRITWQYTMYLYSRLDKITKNGLVVRDGVIDWYYDRILPIFKAAGYKLFVIGFDLSRAKAIELINIRGDTPTAKEERLYNIIYDHEIHIKRFRSEYTPNVTLTDNNIFDHDLVIRKLRDFLDQL